MKREFNYGIITLEDIENNSHLIFICDGNYKRVIVEREENNESN